jgi:DNA-binding transcriptional LysR family regulator
MASELKQLRFCLAAADHGSFRRAAAALQVESSILSRAVRAMELRLGVDLFIRSRVGVRPSSAGTAFLRNARRIVEDVDRMLKTAIKAGRGAAGILTVGFHTSLSAGNLRATLLDYVARYPDIHLDLIERDRCDLFHQIDMGALDIAIVAGELSHPATQTLPLWSERIMIGLREGHPLAQRDRLYWTDLREATFVLTARDPGSGFCDLLISKLAQPGYRPPIIVQDASRETVLHLLSQADDLTVVCETSSGVRYPGVVLREVHDLSGPSRIGWSGCWRTDTENPALQRFLDLLKERYSLAGLSG